VGLAVAGLVDVLALYGLSRIVGAEDRRRQRLNDRGRSLIELGGDYDHDPEYRNKVNAFLWDNRLHLEDLDRDVSNALLTDTASRALRVRWVDHLRLPIEWD
jgi:hypothetical protein